MRLRLIIGLATLLGLTGCWPTTTPSSPPPAVSTTSEASPATYYEPQARFSSVTGQVKFATEQLFDMFQRHLGHGFKAIYLGEYSGARMYLGTGSDWACAGFSTSTHSSVGCNRILSASDTRIMSSTTFPGMQVMTIIGVPDGFTTASMEAATCSVHRNAVIILGGDVENARIELSGGPSPTVRWEDGVTHGSATCFPASTR